MNKTMEEFKLWLDKEIESWKREEEAEVKNQIPSPCAKYHVIALKNVKGYLFGDKK
jgi:hypothetical protein